MQKYLHDFHCIGLSGLRPVAFSLLVAILLTTPGWADCPPDCLVHCPGIQAGDPPGQYIVPDPRIAVVYWASSEAAWDQAAGPQLSKARIDAYLQALVRSTYFSKLTQYGVSPPEIVTTVMSGPNCRDPNSYSPDPNTGLAVAPIYGVDPVSGCVVGLVAVGVTTGPLGLVVWGVTPCVVGGVVGGVVEVVAGGDDLNTLVGCVKNRNATQFEDVNLVLLLLPPPHGQPGQSGITTTGSLAFHVMLSDVSTAVIPLGLVATKAPSYDPPLTLIQMTMILASHEVVEGITNPHQPIGQDGWTETHRIMFTNEIADWCAALPFLEAQAAGYWSQFEDHACVTSFPTSGNADIASPLLIFGCGPNMRIMVDGTGFGDGLPWDFAAPGNASEFTLYLRATVSSTATSPVLLEAGNRFAVAPLVPVGLRIHDWTPNHVQIDGFGPGLANSAGITPGDTLLMAIANQEDGQFDRRSGTVPVPAEIHDEPEVWPEARSPLLPRSLVALRVGETLTIVGQLRDSSHAPEGRVPIRLHASSGTLSTTDFRTDDDGLLKVLFTAPASAGAVTIDGSFPGINSHTLSPVNWTVPVAPIVNGLTPSHGDKAGNTVVTIIGSGFVKGHTTVKFNGVSATILAPFSPTQLRVQAPAAAHVGPAVVEVAVDAIRAVVEGSTAFTYIIPDVAYLTFSKPGCGTSLLTAEVYDINGLPKSVAIGVKATEGLFVTSGSPFTQGGSTADVFTGATDSTGQVRVLMQTAGSNANRIAVANLHGTQPATSADEAAEIKVMAHTFCQHLRNATRNLHVRFVLNERLLSEIVDGCFACDLPSKYQVRWQSATPALEGLSVIGFSSDAAVAERLSISVMGSKAAAPILKRSPLKAEVVGLIQVSGDVGKMPLELTYAPQKAEKFALMKLEKGKWKAVQSIRKASRGISARLIGEGVYALVVAAS